MKPADKTLHELEPLGNFLLYKILFLNPFLQML